MDKLSSLLCCKSNDAQEPPYTPTMSVSSRGDSADEHNWQKAWEAHLLAPCRPPPKDIIKKELGVTDKGNDDKLSTGGGGHHEDPKNMLVGDHADQKLVLESNCMPGHLRSTPGRRASEKIKMELGNTDEGIDDKFSFGKVRYHVDDKEALVDERADQKKELAKPGEGSDKKISTGEVLVHEGDKEALVNDGADQKKDLVNSEESSDEKLFTGKVGNHEADKEELVSKQANEKNLTFSTSSSSSSDESDFTYIDGSGLQSIEIEIVVVDDANGEEENAV